MLKKNAVIYVLMSITLLLSACGAAEEDPGNITSNHVSGKLVIEGSTSMQMMMQEMGDAYSEKNKSITVEYIGDGSSAGIKAAIDNKCNFGAASRAIRDEEKNQGLEVTQVAWDAIAIVVNPGNGVKNLTSEQIAKIYTKEITNWKEVGGNDAPIVVVARDQASGTREAFETIFNVSDKVQADQEAAKTGEVKTVVSMNPNAIGYISLTYADDKVKVLDIDGVAATYENVKNGSYTVKRPFNLVTLGQPNTLEQAFIDFMFSEEGKAIISKEAIPVER